jgi:uncharacterized protein (TIGR01777 family)
MKIVIPGGAGHLGTILAGSLHGRGHDVVVLSRTIQSAPWRVVQWNAKTRGPWQRELDGAFAVINLAGRNVNCRYHSANRREIFDSRVDSTRILGMAASACAYPPKVWLQSSTATIYAHRYDAPNDERTGILGGGEPNAPDTWKFSIDVAKAWEQAFDELELPKTRKVKMRTAIVMSRDPEAAFELLHTLVRRGLGGRAGGGRQFMSWIHHDDFVRAVVWLLDRDELSGAINIASPNPLPNAEFMRELREAAGIRIGLPSTEWMLELGAFAMRSETELILKSRRVIPARLVESGFTFRFPRWPDAVRDLIAERAAMAA